MSWSYKEQVEIIFGNGEIKKVADYTREYKRPLLITTLGMKKRGLATRLLRQWNIEDIFTDVSPNPDVAEVNLCSQYIREHENDLIVAVGGGSVLDLAKAASVVSPDIREYHDTGKLLPNGHIPVIAIPTTSGTGSEVTAVSVLTDREKHKKAPISSNEFYPYLAIIDPELTYTLPKEITASSGMDALSHAIEAYWSKNRQPITCALAIHAIELIIRYLPIAYEDGEDKVAREKLSEASVIAGLAFNLPKTTSSHACSYPLTNLYHIPHGEAVAMTIDSFIRINGEHESVIELARKLGYADTDAFCSEVSALKKKVGLTRGLKEFHLDKAAIDKLVQLSHHPNLLNNPVEITDEMLEEIYRNLSKY